MRKAWFFIHLCSFVFLTKLCLGAESPSIGDSEVFPSDNPWHWDISEYAVHPNSDAYISSIGADIGLHPDFGSSWQGNPIGIPYTVVDTSQQKIPVTWTAYGSESDPGPYRIPLDAPIEGGPESGGDRHVIVVDTSNDTLYELFHAFPGTDEWEARSGAVFDLSINDHHPDGYTSADAAGLPIFPGLIRYEEVYNDQEIDHAVRFTVQHSQSSYIFPARHFASDSADENLPPMGLRFRLKADYDISGFSEPIQVILRAFKKHGLILADNGSNWFISGAHDERWDNDLLHEIDVLTGSDFEVVQSVDSDGDPIYPGSGVESKAEYFERESLYIDQKGSGSGIFSVEFSTNTNTDFSGSISVYNLRGERVYKTVRISVNNSEISLDRLTSGVYYLKLECNGEVFRERVSIVR